MTEPLKGKYPEGLTVINADDYPSELAAIRSLPDEGGVVISGAADIYVSKRGVALARGGWPPV